MTEHMVVCGNMGVYEDIWEHLGVYGNMWGYVGVSESIKDNVGCQSKWKQGGHRGSSVLPAATLGLSIYIGHMVPFSKDSWDGLGATEAVLTSLGSDALYLRQKCGPLAGAIVQRIGHLPST